MDKEILKKVAKGTGLSGGAAALIFYLHSVALAKIDKAVTQISLNKTDIAVLKEIKDDIKDFKTDIKEIKNDIKDLLRNK
jgi:predicted phage-related endonuclease